MRPFTCRAQELGPTYDCNFTKTFDADLVSSLDAIDAYEGVRQVNLRGEKPFFIKGDDVARLEAFLGIGDNVIDRRITCGPNPLWH